MWEYSNYAELYHHGILGQKWGVRRFQNEDGSLTEAGRLRYYFKDQEKLNSRYRSYRRQEENILRAQRLVGKMGKIGEAIWYTSFYAFRDRAKYELAIRRVQKVLDEMQDKYVVVYDPSEDEFVIEDIL